MTKRDWEKDWQLCERATPGPWTVAEARRNEYPFDREWVCIAGYKWDYTTKTIYVLPPSEVEVIDDTLNDARFIAEAREALPYWLQRVKELEEENKKLKERLKEIEKVLGCRCPKCSKTEEDWICFKEYCLKKAREENEGAGSTPD